MLSQIYPLTVPHTSTYCPTYTHTVPHNYIHTLSQTLHPHTVPHTYIHTLSHMHPYTAPHTYIHILSHIKGLHHFSSLLWVVHTLKHVGSIATCNSTATSLKAVTEQWKVSALRSSASLRLKMSWSQNTYSCWKWRRVNSFWLINNKRPTPILPLLLLLFLLLLLLCVLVDSDGCWTPWSKFPELKHLQLLQ